ncbi:MAG: (S)-ureidoglycine aminohydrolase [Chloroflexota bacterium]
MKPPGQTRTIIQANHAFIAPDGYVTATLPAWENTQGIILISPHMRGLPRFSMYIAHMDANAKSAMPLDRVQRFVYILSGSISATLDEDQHKLSEGEFVYIPVDTSHQLTTTEATSLLIFEKPYVETKQTSELPSFHVGNAWAGDGEPFLGDQDARLRTLLPTHLQYDMAVNLFTFQSGAALPFVETHIMEHGLYLLEGQGIYRLDESYYPIQAGDVIWMGAYCPQWFCAFGKTQSTYIYYKDVNRDPLS